MKKRKLTKSPTFQGAIHKPISAEHYVPGMGTVVQIDGIDLFIMATSIENLKKAWKIVDKSNLEDRHIHKYIMLDGRV